MSNLRIRVRQILAGVCLFSFFIGINLSALDNKGLFSSFTTQDLITFQPNQEYERVVLTVKGPNGITTQEFSGLNIPFLEVYDASGNLLNDGQYTYELRAIPKISSEAKEIIRAARASGDYAAIDALRERGELPSGPMVHSGYFQIYNGYIVSPDEIEKATPEISMKSDGRDDGSTPGNPNPADDVVVVDDPKDNDDSDLNTRDQVINDDLIVTFSACIGNDCVNGESFGFDTLKLKENNLRIKFDDTSNSASFPNNDWQITANDSTNGGANKFSVDDITGGRTPFTIEASAPSHSLYVDDGGRIGLGTSTPVVELHVVDGDSPTLRLEQDGSSGFTPQTWDLAGNETNFFVRDVTNGSKLPFRIRPTAPTNSIYVDTDGDVGMNTSSPGASLHVRRTDGSAQLYVEEASSTVDNAREQMILANNGYARFRLDNNDEGGTWSFVNRGTNVLISRNGSGAEEMIINETSGNVTIAGTLTQNSDRNSKENFEPVDPQEVLDKVAQMDITTWNFKTDAGDIRHMGPMAQDFAQFFGLGEYENKISLIDVDGVTLAAIKGLNERLQQKDAELEEKAQEIEDLKRQNLEIGNRLQAIESLISDLRDNK